MKEYKARKELMFDLDTKKLSELFGESKYRNCYAMLQKSLEKQGFVHEQGSVYNSIKRITDYEVTRIIDKVTQENAWLKVATNKMQFGDMPKYKDLTNVIAQAEVSDEKYIQGNAPQKGKDKAKDDDDMEM